LTESQISNKQSIGPIPQTNNKAFVTAQAVWPARKTK